MMRYRYDDGTAAGKKIEYDHWWFDRGMPERRIGMAPASRIGSRTPVMFERAGDRWVQVDYVGADVPAQDAIGPRTDWDRGNGR